MFQVKFLPRSRLFICPFFCPSAHGVSKLKLHRFLRELHDLPLVPLLTLTLHLHPPPALSLFLLSPFPPGLALALLGYCAGQDHSPRRLRLVPLLPGTVPLPCPVRLALNLKQIRLASQQGQPPLHLRAQLTLRLDLHPLAPALLVDPPPRCLAIFPLDPGPQHFRPFRLLPLSLVRCPPRRSLLLLLLLLLVSPRPLFGFVRQLLLMRLSRLRLRSPPRILA